MADLLTQQLHQLAFAVVTGTLRLSDEQRQAIADLNASAAVVDTSADVLSSRPGLRPALIRPKLRLVPHTKEPA